MAYREFYTCTHCGRVFYDACLTCGWAYREHEIICPSYRSIEKPEKKNYFICPTCFEPILEEIKLKNPEYNLAGHNYCTNCGNEINSILKEERSSCEQAKSKANFI